MAPAVPPRTTPRYEADSREGRDCTEMFDSEVTRGRWHKLSPEQAADPDTVHFIAGVRIAYKDKPIIPPAAAEAVRDKAGGLDVHEIAKHADTAAAARYTAYSNDVNADPSPAGRVAAFQRAVTSSSTPGKKRLITQLDKTVNKHTKDLSVRYSTIGDVMGAARPGDDIIVLDGKDAYGQCLIHPAYRKYFCIQHPVTLDIYVPDYWLFGGDQFCTVFSGIGAVMKRIIEAGPPATVGDASGGDGAPASTSMPAVAVPATAAAAGTVPTAAIPATGAAAVSAPTTAGVKCIHSSGVIDDMAFVSSHTDSPAVLQYARDVYHLCNYTSAEQKQQCASTVTYLGGTLDTDTGTATVRGPKLYATLLDVFFLQRVLRGSTEARVPAPFLFIESLVGSIGWLAQFTLTLRLRQAGLRAALYACKVTHSPHVNLATAAVRADINYIADRALSGKWGATQYFSSTTVAAIALCMPMPTRHGSSEDARLLQLIVPAMPAVGAARAVMGSVSDGSVDPTDPNTGTMGARAYAARTSTPGGGADEVIYGLVEPGSSLDSSDSSVVELMPVYASLLRNKGRARGKVFVVGTDSVANAHRINSGRVRGAVALKMMQRIYDIADEYCIDLVAIWVPRAANQSLDAFSKCRSDAEAAAGASAAGLHLVRLA